MAIMRPSGRKFGLIAASSPDRTVGYVASPMEKHPLVRFGEIELDTRTGEVFRHGIALKLQPQPARILLLLVRRAGEVVGRDEIVREVWGGDTFVDYEQGLNFAVRQIRTVLHDDADHPRYVETLPKRGYRFIAPLEDAQPVSP